MQFASPASPLASNQLKIKKKRHLLRHLASPFASPCVTFGVKSTFFGGKVMSLMDMIDLSIERAKQAQEEKNAQQQEKNYKTKVTEKQKVEDSARTDEKEIETNGVDYVDSEEEKAAAKEYFNRCHSQINHVRARKWLLKKGWDDKDIDRWNIGFDVEENAIIVPVDEMYYGKYTID